MLINNVNGERVGASFVKNSNFYIEVAKFVQAYTTIVNNPNEFLKEVGLSFIDEKKDRLNWNQFVKIVQGCDLGFKEIPTETELKVYYNYALEIGSLDSSVKKLATVDDVADAQKHYYNFIDEATDKAQNEYMKHHKVALSREREAANADNQLTLHKTLNIVSLVFMMFGVGFSIFGIASFFWKNDIAVTIGSIIPIWEKQYIGAIILTGLGVALFAIFDKFYLKSKDKYLDLKVATSMIFKRSDETFAREQALKNKLDKLKKDLSTIQAELADKDKKFDVKHNIDLLKTTNKYYQKLCEIEDEMFSSNSVQRAASQTMGQLGDEDFAPVKLSKEEFENLHAVSKEAITLEGTFDEEAYNAKFEQSRVQEQKPEKQEKVEDLKEVKEEKQEQSTEEEAKKEEELLEAIDYIKDILGFGLMEEQNEQIEEQEEQEKQKEIEEKINEK